MSAFAEETETPKDNILAVEEDEESDKEDFSGWTAGEDDDEDLRVRSLFGHAKLPNIAEMIAHDKRIFNFDLSAIVKEHCTDDFSYIKLINFIRTYASGFDPSELDMSALVDKITRKMHLEGDLYLKPVLEDDPLLFLFEEIFELEGTEDTVPPELPPSAASSAADC